MASQKKILMILTVVLAAVLIYACIPSKGEEEDKIKKVNLDALKETEDETADSLTLTDSVQVEVQYHKTTYSPRWRVNGRGTLTPVRRLLRRQRT